MNSIAASMILAACLASGNADTYALGAPSAASPSTGSRKTVGPDAKVLKSAAVDSSASPAHRSHVFFVNDEKGLLLTCIAPEIETNPKTDLFEDCTLARGRTLDDVMHSFVGAMHTEESQRAQEREQWDKALGEKAGQTSEKK
ncbi:MAG: hypothetical protein ABSG51_14005 [Terracidiphilus sp.]|jgi:hypothetical protein